MQYSHEKSTITNAPEAKNFPSKNVGAAARLVLRVAAATLVLAAAALSVGAATAAAAGLWTSAAELRTRPMSGSAWTKMKAAADAPLGTPSIADQNSKHDTSTLAVALVYARTGNAAYRAKAANAITGAIGTEAGGRSLALGRNLVSYVIAADLIDLRSYDAAADARFRTWLRAVIRKVNSDGTTLIGTHERRPNNWGTMAGASRIAADLYLGDATDLARAVQVFKGWLGDRTAYAGFSWGDLSWQANPTKPVAINPVGAVKAGHSIDGALPDDMRRGCAFTWPPCYTDYPWGALEGALVQAELLYRAGYDAYNWQNQALRRACDFLYRLDEEVGYWYGTAISGDESWQPWIMNRRYGTRFPAASPTRPGKNMGWTDFTHGG